MRLAVCALSAVLLSGCAWMPWGSGGHGGKHAMKSNYGASQGGHYKGQQRRHNPCQIFSPAQPVPQGCNPSQVTLAAQGPQGGFPQQPDFSGGYTSQGYGSHVAQAGQHAALQGPQKPRLKKPKWRGQLSVGMDAAISGLYLDQDKDPEFNPAGTFIPASFNQGTISTGSPGEGFTSDDTYSTTVESVNLEDLSFDDVHSTPKRISGGLEYIASPNTTIFANAGYSHAEGNTIQGAEIVGEVRRDFDTVFYDGGLRIGSNSGFDLIPNLRVASYQLDFGNQDRIDLEMGARHYLDPLFKGYSARAITPFVGVSAGASHYNAQSFDVTQTQLFYADGYSVAYAGETPGDEFFYDVVDGNNTVDVHDAQWVPKGALTAGVEWQMTPKTALAFETGLSVEGGRKYSNGEKTSEQVAIPFTIRGSYNF